ncbi:MAG TPA: hypothetical protein VD995_04485 [Azospirillum sp.]|nr:hypothetical protein [Azospirillum sp.]
MGAITSVKPRLKPHQGEAFRFLVQHEPDMVLSILEEASEIQRVADGQPDSFGRVSAWNNGVHDLLRRTLGSTGMRDIIAGRAAFYRLEEGEDFHAVLAKLSRTIRLMITAGLMIAESSRRMPLGPVTDAALGALYTLALGPALVRAHARAWLSGLKVSDLRAALAPWEGLALAAMACRFEAPFDADDALPRIAAKLPVLARRAA